MPFEFMILALVIATLLIADISFADEFQPLVRPQADRRQVSEHAYRTRTGLSESQKPKLDSNLHDTVDYHIHTSYGYGFTKLQIGNKGRRYRARLRFLLYKHKKLE